MKRSSILVLILTYSLVTYGQNHDSTSYLVFNVATGYTTFALGDVKDFYDGVLSIYKESGLAIPTQKKYPGNVIFGVSAMYNIPSVLRVGIGSQYTWTKAYSGYEDYAGLFEINSKVSLLTLEAVVERDIGSIKTINVFLGVKGAVAFIKSDYSNTISLKDYPTQAGTVSLSGDGNGYSMEGYIGISKVLTPTVTLGVTAGYRSSVIDKIDGKMNIPGEGSYSGKLELEHDLSGLVLNAKIGYRFLTK